MEEQRARFQDKTSDCVPGAARRGATAGAVGPGAFRRAARGGRPPATPWATAAAAVGPGGEGRRGGERDRLDG